MISAEVASAQFELQKQRFLLSEQRKRVHATQPSLWLQPLATVSNYPPVTTTEVAKKNDPSKQAISIAPDLGMAILRMELSAAGRVWHLLRALDTVGSGVVSIETARAALCDKKSPMRAVGWRQLRNLLRVGNDTFWQRDRTQIWLRSRVKVAATLNVSRFRLAIVDVSLVDCVGGIGEYKAALYGAFHAGRDGRPISRATLRDVCGASASSQRNYEASAGVTATAQFAIVGRDRVEARWVHGGHVFEIVDKQGLAGERFRPIQVKQIPNCYASTSTNVRVNSKKRLNRILTDLLAKGATGNGQQRDTRTEFTRLYGIGRGKTVDIHTNTCIPSARSHVWHLIGAGNV